MSRGTVGVDISATLHTACGGITPKEYDFLMESEFKNATIQIQGNSAGVPEPNDYEVMLTVFLGLWTQVHGTTYRDFGRMLFRYFQSNLSRKNLSY